MSAPTDSRIEAELAALCRSCGLCCDGSLFGRVSLEADELAAARKNQLRVLPRGGAFEQPCSALAAVTPGKPGERGCSIYDERPRSCRAFTCVLYERHRRDGGPLEPRLASVRRVRALLDSLATKSLATKAERDDEARRGDVAELTRRIEEDFARARPRAAGS